MTILKNIQATIVATALAGIVLIAFLLKHLHRTVPLSGFMLIAFGLAIDYTLSRRRKRRKHQELKANSKRRLEARRPCAHVTIWMTDSRKVSAPGPTVLTVSRPRRSRKSSFPSKTDPR
jgi:hypothetical protein